MVFTTLHTCVKKSSGLSNGIIKIQKYNSLREIWERKILHAVFWLSLKTKAEILDRIGELYHGKTHKIHKWGIRYIWLDLKVSSHPAWSVAGSNPIDVTPPGCSIYLVKYNLVIDDPL